MTTLSSDLEYNRPRWQAIVCLTLAFWLSSCLLLDLVIMPSLYVSGMLTESGFSSAGTMLFGMFNRMELICAALGMTGVLVLSNWFKQSVGHNYKVMLMAIALLAIVFIDTYALTPQMSAIGIQLNLFSPVCEVPPAMDQLHGSYFGLEVVKISLVGMLLYWSYQPSQSEQ